MTISEKLTDLESIEQNKSAEMHNSCMLIEPNQEGRVIEPPNGSQERGCEQSSYATTATSEDGKHRVRAVPESILRLSLERVDIK